MQEGQGPEKKQEQELEQEQELPIAWSWLHGKSCFQLCKFIRSLGRHNVLGLVAWYLWNCNTLEIYAV